MVATAPTAKPSQRSEKNPSRKLRAGVVLVVLGLVLGTGLLALGLTSMPDVGAFPRAAGDQQSVDLTAGRWTVFAEGPGLVPQTILGPEEQTIAIEAGNSSARYQYGGRQGTSIGTVDLPTSGTYQVVNQPGGSTAFAQGFASDLVKAIGLIIASAILGLGPLIAGLIISLVALRQQRAGTPT